MRKILVILGLVTVSLVYFACSKENKTDRFVFLTDNTWLSDSLLVNGVDAGGQGGLLEMFVGEAKFNKDGTGTFGQYTGGWYFTNNQTSITITADELDVPLSCQIVELTASSFKITTMFTDPLIGNLNIRITFKAK